MGALDLVSQSQWRAQTDPTYKALQESEERGVLQKFSDISQGFETSASRRGISRSGFAAEQESKIAAGEQGALADVHAGLTDRMMQYQQRQDELNLMKQQQKMGKQKGQNQWLGAALQVAGMAAMALL